MRKFLFICFLSTSANCFSQGLIKGVVNRLSFGLKAGANYSNYANTAFTTEGLTGFHAGGLVNFRITHTLSIQEEFLFSSQGAKIKDGVLGKENVKVNYMSVPFLLKYRSNLGLYIEAGPQVGMRLNENLAGAPLNNFAKKLDLGFAGGLGYQSKIGLGIGVRYVAGISKVGDFNISNVPSDFRTSVAQASVFYIF